MIGGHVRSSDIASTIIVSTWIEMLENNEATTIIRLYKCQFIEKKSVTNVIGHGPC